MKRTTDTFRLFGVTAAAVLWVAGCGEVGNGGAVEGRGPAFAPVREASDEIGIQRSALVGSENIFDTRDNPFLGGTSNQGWWSPSEDNSADNDNYFMGRFGGDEFRNFFTFDLSGLNLSGRTVVRASLLVSNGGRSGSMLKTIGLYEVSTDAATLNDNAGTSQEIFDDLGSGDSYGSLSTFADPSQALLTFELNAVARADIEAAAGGSFSIGGAIENLSASGDDYLFGYTGGSSGLQRLLLCFNDDPDGDGDGHCDAVDNCPTDANPSQEDANGDGVGDACRDDDYDGIISGDNCPRHYNPGQADSDGDGAGDACDVCAGLSNPDQLDSDTDGLGDACDNCPTSYNWDQTDSDGDGLGDACEDRDGDNIFDSLDNCADVSNPDQLDSDGDWRGDACDNCPTSYNWDQSDSDGDGLGDACEDSDGDGTFDYFDNCLSIPNPDQLDSDWDWRGDACDNCPSVYNWDQSDSNGDGLGDMCEDLDNDGSPDVFDNCVDVPNPDQSDRDWDWRGDACDNCPSVYNWDQTDSDGDGVGDVCLDSEGDGVPDAIDNCPALANPDQADSDYDALGDACDPTPLHDLAISKTRAHHVNIARGSSWLVGVKVQVRNRTSSPEMLYVSTWPMTSLPFGCSFASWPSYQVATLGGLSSAIFDFDYRVHCDAAATPGTSTVLFEAQTFQWDSSNGYELDTSNNFGTTTATITVQ